MWSLEVQQVFGCPLNVEQIGGCVGHLAECWMATLQRGHGLRGGGETPCGAAGAGERRGSIGVATAAQTPAGPLNGWCGRRPLPGCGGRGVGDRGRVPDKEMAQGGNDGCLGTATVAVTGTIAWMCRWRGRRPRPRPLRQRRATQGRSPPGQGGVGAGVCSCDGAAHNGGVNRWRATGHAQ